MSIKFDINKIEIVPHYKYLGLTIDQKLNFEQHVKNPINNKKNKLYTNSENSEYL